MPDIAIDPAALIPVVDGIPGPWGLLAALLYLTFVVHILLMNAVVGVTLITLISSLRASLTPVQRADLHAQGTLLPKGVAFVVNFGVPPFLFLQGIYGQYIYSSSILLGVWWLSVMLVVMLAYYGLYINMTTRGLTDKARTLALGLAAVLLLWNAFIFVNNATLLQSPARWLVYAQDSSGTFLNLGDPQLFPRYLHIILACFAVGGLCIAMPAHYRLRALARVNAPVQELNRYLTRMQGGLNWFFYPTLMQFLAGGWFLLSLPPVQRSLFLGGNLHATAALVAADILIVTSLVMAKRERPLPAVLCTVAVVFLMAGLRTMLRSSMLEPYYNPALRPFDGGPLWLFLGSLAASAVVVVWLAKVYAKQPPVPVTTEPLAAGSDSGFLDMAEERDHDVVLVNEIASPAEDYTDAEEAPDTAAGTTQAKGEKS